MTRRSAALLLLACLSPIGASGADRTSPSLEVVEMPEISSSPSRPMLQDHRGFIWFGMVGRLLRYDGHEMRTFGLPLPAASTHWGGRVSGLCEDSDGNLWVATWGAGLYRLDRATGAIAVFAHEAGDPNTLTSDTITALFEDTRGGIWIGYGDGNGLDRFDRVVRSFTSYSLDSGHDPATRVISIAEDRGGLLWVLTSEGLATLDPGSGAWNGFQANPRDPRALPDERLWRLMTTPDGTLWVIGNIGLSRWDGVRRAFVTYRPPGATPQISASAAAPDGTIWIWRNSAGACKFTPATGRFQCWTDVPFALGGRESDSVGTLFADSSGTLWAVTFTGCYRWNPARSDVSSLLVTEPTVAEVLEGGYVTALHRGRAGTVWLSVLGRGNERPGYRLVEWNRQASTVRRYSPGKSNSSTALWFTVIESDREGTIWVGTNMGLARLDREAGLVRPVKVPVTLGKTRITALESDAEGFLWLGTDADGVFRYDPRTRLAHRYPLAPVDSSNPAAAQVVALLADSRGRLWVGSGGSGVYLHEPGTHGLKHFYDKKGGLSDIDALAEDRRGRIWAGTNGGGLHRLNPALGSVERLTRTQGLPDDLVLSILGDRDGRLWLVSGGQLVRFDPDSRALRSFGPADGFPILRGWWPHSVCAGDDGALFISNGDQLVVFDPAELEEQRFETTVALTGLDISGQPIEVGEGSPIDLPDALELNHREKNLTFTFASLDFSRSEGNHYAYILEGYEQDWHRVGQRYTASYTNLDPGDYVFRVRATNGDGVWSPNEASIQISIRPPWWSSAWFRFGLSALILALGVGTARTLVARERLRSQVRLKEAEAAHLRHVDGLKSRFFANISHEFRTPLTLLLGPLEDLRRHSSGTDNNLLGVMCRNARRLLELVDQLLDLSRLEAGRLQLALEEGRPIETVRHIVSTFQGLIEQKRITLRTLFPGDERVAGWIDRDALEKIVSNLLSNAVKFTPDEGLIEVECTVRDDGASPHSRRRRLVVAVRDTGPGIDPAEAEQVFDRFYRSENTEQATGAGIGLALMRELVDLHGGRVWVENEPGSGACFTVELPIDEGAFEPYHLRRRPPTDVIEKTPATAGVGLPLAEDDGAPSDEFEATRPLVLIVEDNVDLRTYLRAQLEASYEILDAGNGKQGLEIALARVPDLVVSDVVMPVMNGIELCRKLKDDERTSHVPVILLTARSSHENTIEGLETRADDYVTKPFDSRELLIRIRNLVELRRQLRENYRRSVIAVEPEVGEIDSFEDRFLRRVQGVLEKRLDDAELTTEQFAGDLHVSRMQLHRKLKALTGMSARDFVRTYRLNRAAQLLSSDFGNVTEVAWSVGFKNLPHFTESFRNQFGVPPSEFRTRSKAGH